MRSDTLLAELEAVHALFLPSGLSLKLSNASKENQVNSSNHVIYFSVIDHYRMIAGNQANNSDFLDN
jgi:hypothetical protein